MKAVISSLLVVLFGCTTFMGTAWVIRETWVLYHSPFLLTVLFIAWSAVYLVVLRVWARRILQI